MKTFLTKGSLTRLLAIAFLLFSTEALIAQPMCADIFTGIRINELNVYYDRDLNAVVIDNLECDPCAYATGEEVAACNCDLSCRDNFDECEEVCYDNFTNLTQLGECLDNCYDDLSGCLNGCPEVQPIRTATGYIYEISFWWTTMLEIDGSGPPNQTFSSDDGVFEDLPSQISMTIDEDLSELSISYCYSIELLVIYDDDTCCLYLDQECFHLG